MDIENQTNEIITTEPNNNECCIILCIKITSFITLITVITIALAIPLIYLFIYLYNFVGITF